MRTLCGEVQHQRLSDAIIRLFMPERAAPAAMNELLLLSMYLQL